MERFQSIGEVLAAYRRRWWLVLVVVLLGCVGSVVFALNMSRAYQAVAVVQIEDPRVTEELAGLPDDSDRASRQFQLIEQRLMARDTLVEVMDRFGLFADDPSLPVQERLTLMRTAVTLEPINNPVSGRRMATPSGIYIFVRLSDPQKAADVANYLMTQLIDQSRARASSRARETLDFFEEEETRVRDRTETMSAVLADFKREHAAQLPEGVTELRMELADLRSAEFDIDREILTLRAETARTREDVTERRIALLEDQRALLQARRAEVQALIASAPDVERELDAMERELEQLQEEFTVISRRKAEAQLGQMLEERQQSARFEVLETALVPEQPVTRSRRSVAALGAIGSVIAALGVVFVLEMLQPVIRTAGQMERTLGVAPVVAIPKVDRGSRRRRGPAGTGWTTSMVAGVSAMLGAQLAR